MRVAALVRQYPGWSMSPQTPESNTPVAEPASSPEPVSAPLSIGPLTVDPPVVLAPMAGVTNAPYRSMCREFGAGLYVSEMITSRAIVERHPATLRRARFAPDESPRSIQLYGTDPDAIGGAARYLVEEDAVDHIDLNFGCPAPKVTRNGGGSALPFKRRLLASVVRAAVDGAGDVPVTVKVRLGVDDDHLTFLDAGRIAEDVGAKAIALHARTAEQLYSGNARWETIAVLKNHVSIPVLGNGDIWEASDAIEMMRLTGCDGVVVGRGCLGRPWMFRDLADAFAGRPVQGPPNLGQVAVTMVDHAKRLIDHMGERGIRDFRKHTGWYLKGYPVGGRIRGSFNQVDSLSQLEDLLSELDPTTELPADALRLPRGHTHGPRPVATPDRWLLDPEDEAVAGRDGLLAVSGG